MVPPSVKHFDRVLHELDTATPSECRWVREAARDPRLGASADAASSPSSRISTWSPSPCIDSLVELRYRGHDVLVFHILDPDEVSLPRSGGAPVPGHGERDAPAGRARSDAGVL